MKTTIDLNELDVLGIHGPLDGGKDTIAHYIIKTNPQFVKYAFAGPLKAAAQQIFGFSDMQLEDRRLKELVDEFWGITPRRVCQLLGTEFGRDMIAPDIWIRRAELQIKKNLDMGYRTIITDVRFENEAEWIRSLPRSGLLYLDTPGITRDERYQHASEAGIRFVPGFDVRFENDKTRGLSWLYTELERIIK